jgi:hypothetical protein
MMVALGTLIAPAMAAPTADLNALAKYFPASAPVLISFRTDDAYIKEIDDLFAKIAAQIPGMKQPDTIAHQFDNVVNEVIGKGDFASEMRTWLGDTASIGIFSFEGMMGRADSGSDNKPPHFLAAVAITDQKAAEAFWKTALAKSPSGDYQSSTEGDFILLTPGKDSKAEGIVAIGKDVLFIGAYKEDLPLKGQTDSLSDSATFADSITQLPESDYNITIYANLGTFLKQMMEMQSSTMGNDPSQAAMMQSIEPMLKNFPPEVIGFTVLDERSLTVDIVVPYGDLLKDFEKAGFSTAMPAPVDPTYAANILSGSPLVIHSTNLGASLEGVIKSLQTQAGMMQSTGMSVTELEDGLNKLKFAIQGLTGKDLEKDILPAMTGDYALYVTLSPALSDLSSPADLAKQMPVDFGFLTEMSDPTISKALIDGIKTAIGSMKDAQVKVTTEQIAGTDAVVITGTGADMPFPIELVLTGNDKRFFFGTRRAAAAALTGKGGLDGDAAFKEASGYLVPSPSVIAYLAGDGLKPLSKIIGMTSSETSAKQFDAFLKLVSSASISSTTKDNVAFARLVWTMPQ